MEYTKKLGLRSTYCSAEHFVLPAFTSCDRGNLPCQRHMPVPTETDGALQQVLPLVLYNDYTPSATGVSTC